MAYKDSIKQKEYHKQWRDKNKEKHRAYYKHWRENNMEKDKATKQKYQENREKILKQKREYYQTHKEELDKKAREYKELHKEAIYKSNNTNTKRRNVESRLSANNHRQAWEPHEIEILIRMKRQNKSAKKIAQYLGRTIAAINTKVAHLRKEGDPFNGNPIDI